jgi:predicted O-linked N-acetylglucosamine transferase (SPINDLY family)
MAHMNVDDDNAFIIRAIELGHDPSALSTVRDELARRRRDSGLFDMAGFARDFAAAVRAMQPA